MQRQTIGQSRGSSWRAALWTLVLATNGCGSRTQETFDSQSHWLSCEANAQCGDLACECGLCTRSCDTDEECWAALGTGAARCQTIESFGCKTSTATRLCVPDCAGTRCVSEPDTDPEGGIDSTLLGQSTPDLVSVPECPSLSPTVGLPAGFRTNLSDYFGPATVGESTAERIQLVPDAVTGEVVEITNHPSEVAQLFVAGQRFETELESTTANGGYKGLVIRNDDGEVLFAVYHGYDAWYQAGRFSDPTFLGGTLELRMTCQTNIGDACFASQVQSSYVGIFTADTNANVDGSKYESVTIGGRAYGVYLWAAGVFGGERMSDCNPDIVQGRTLAFVLYRKG
jgi:hypothetical protein